MRVQGKETLVDDRLRLTYGCPMDTDPSLSFDRAPAQAARDLFTAAREAGRDRWLARFTDALERQLGRGDLETVMRAWSLSQAEVGELFGVTRQAVAKWRRTGIPADRVVALADLAAASELLSRYLRPQRVAAVVRRPAPALGGQSLLEMAREGRTREVLEAARAMFDLAGVHA